MHVHKESAQKKTPAKVGFLLFSCSCTLLHFHNTFKYLCFHMLSDNALHELASLTIRQPLFVISDEVLLLWDTSFYDWNNTCGKII